MIPYTELCYLAEKHGTDKRPEPLGHGYTHYYHSLFGARREAVHKVLEIGIDIGASLRMWEDYFPNAAIYAIDCDPNKLIDKGRIVSLLCDQGDERALQDIVPLLGVGFDLILDDGSHIINHQIVSARALAPLLAPGGVYIIEDVLDPDLVMPYLPLASQLHEFKVDRDPYSKLVVMRAAS